MVAENRPGLAKEVAEGVLDGMNKKFDVLQKSESITCDIGELPAYWFGNCVMSDVIKFSFHNKHILYKDKHQNTTVCWTYSYEAVAQKQAA